MSDLEFSSLHKVHATQIVVPVEMHKVTKVRLVRLHLQPIEQYSLLHYVLTLLYMHWIVELYLEERFLVSVISVDRILPHHLDVVHILIVSAFKFLLQRSR